MSLFRLQETIDGNCPAGCWRDFDAAGLVAATACEALTNVVGWVRTEEPLYDLRRGYRLIRLQEKDEKTGRWSQCWMSRSPKDEKTGQWSQTWMSRHE
jgi:hypothetical protein